MRPLEGVTPHEVAYTIRDLITDKVVCDVGCGEGNFMEALQPFAKEVIGMEENEDWAYTAAYKGFKIYQGNTFFQPLPRADVYYLWTKDAMGIFLKAQWEGTTGTFIFGKSVRQSLVAFLAAMGAEKRKVKGVKDWWVHILTL